MSTYSLSHLTDQVLLRDLATLVAQDRTTTAELLAHIAEVDARRLYLEAGYPSMHTYCVDELRLSEDAAYKRIQAARAARQFPILFTALAEGRLHLTAVRLLAPHLTPENADELLAAATHQRTTEIEVLLARQFPRARVPAMAHAVAALTPLPDPQLAAGQVAIHVPELGGELAAGQVAAHAPQLVGELAPGQVDGSPLEAAPLPPERFLLRVTIDKSTHDKLRYAQALLSHPLPSGDVAQVLGRALDALIGQLEKRKFGVTTNPRPQPRPRPSATARKRYVPAHVRRAVWERDQGQCTFVSEAGHRCSARSFLEFDHVDPVARGGQATVERMRLRCRAHNQYEAERAFGTGFMSEKRNEARRAAAEARAKAEARAAGEARAKTAEAEAARERDVIPWLRRLGFRVDEARRGAAACETIPDAPLEERLRLALSSLAPGRRLATNTVGSAA